MLEKPDIPDSAIMACLQADYNLTAALAFLPIGADRHSAVYRAVTAGSAAYFVKLRGGAFDEMTVRIPKLLYDAGIAQVIPPIATQSGALWTTVGDFILAVFPFVEGRDAYDVAMLDRHWVEFGQTLQGIHAVVLPPEIAARIQRETYTPHYREAVRRFLQTTAETTYDDPVAAGLSALLQRQHDTITTLVNRAEALATTLLAQSPPFVLCHADIHAGNILIDNSGRLYIVDWDTLIFAPKERDLMYAGGGQFPHHRTPHEEETLFYQGYTATRPDPAGLAYYRYERIVQDIAAYCQQILLGDAHGADRVEGLRQLAGQFQPGSVVDIAFSAATNNR